ncbi:MAG: hypothetical protein H0U70_04135 [Tatlockia sp.]|nr:hypothetical protein [Tatlockia sp.]
MFGKIEVKKDARKVALDFNVNIPEKLIFHGKYPALSEGFLCIKLGKTQYLAKLELGNNHPIFVNVGEPINGLQAIDNFFKCTSYGRRLDNEVPIIEMTSYNSMQLIHLVGMETGTKPANVRCPSITTAVRAELLNNKIALPELTKGLSDDRNSVSNVWINIDIGKNGDFETGFNIEHYLEDEQDTNAYSC